MLTQRKIKISGYNSFERKMYRKREKCTVMIYANANYTDDNRVRLVIVQPDGEEKTPLTVADYSEAKRLVYFYNRQYFKKQLTEWLAQRINAFEHASPIDTARIRLAEQLTEAILKHSNAFFPLCGKIISSTPALLKVAPSAQSRHHTKYQDDILPIIKYCHNLFEVDFEA